MSSNQDSVPHKEDPMKTILATVLAGAFLFSAVPAAITYALGSIVGVGVG